MRNYEYFDRLQWVKDKKGFTDQYVKLYLPDDEFGIAYRNTNSMDKIYLTPHFFDRFKAVNAKITTCNVSNTIRIEVDNLTFLGFSGRGLLSPISIENDRFNVQLVAPISINTPVFNQVKEHLLCEWDKLETLALFLQNKVSKDSHYCHQSVFDLLDNKPYDSLGVLGFICSIAGGDKDLDSFMQENKEAILFRLVSMASNTLLRSYESLNHTFEFPLEFVEL